MAQETVDEAQGAGASAISSGEPEIASTNGATGTDPESVALDEQQEQGNKEEQEGAASVTATVAPLKANGSLLDLRSAATAPASRSTSPTEDRAQRSGRKIANLLATFEKKNSDDSLGRTISKTRSREQDPEILRVKDTEVAKLKEQLRAESEARHALERKCSALEEETGRLHEKLKRHDSEWMAEMARQSAALMHERDVAHEEHLEVKRQLLGLKQSISTSTRLENQVADSMFAQEIQHLYHEIQNWVINNFRKVKIERTPEEICSRLIGIAEPRQVELLKPLFENYDPSLKIVALQAVVACYIMEIFEDPLLFGLPPKTDWRRGIKRASESLPSILPPAVYNKWRATTLDMIKQTPQMKHHFDSASSSLAEMICITLHTLTEVEESPAKVDSLNAIIKRIIALSHVFRVQRAQFDFHLPLPGTPFDPAMMEEDCAKEAETQCQIRCALFPVVVKYGDEKGENVESSNTIVKAKVLCSP
jgi:hypothetical protein